MLHNYNSQKWRIQRAPTPENPEFWETMVTSTTDSSVQYKFRTSMVYDLPCLNCCPQSRYDLINNGIQYRSTDILVATYPKCGTTWSEQCALLLMNGANPSQLNPVHKNSYHPNLQFGKIWPEAMILQTVDLNPDADGEFINLSWEEFNTAPSPRILKTHMTATLVPGVKDRKDGIATLPEGMKIIVVSRNPLDACVSSYYHSFNPAKSGWPFDAWATAWINGYAQFGDYYQWMKGWYAEYLKYPDRILWVQFEEMKKNPVEETKRIAHFLRVSEDQEFIEKVVHYSSFDNMVKSAKEKGGDSKGHLRKGEVGDWKNHFSPELYELFRQHTLKEFEGTPFQFEY